MIQPFFCRYLAVQASPALPTFLRRTTSLIPVLSVHNISLKNYAGVWDFLQTDSTFDNAAWYHSPCVVQIGIRDIAWQSPSYSDRGIPLPK